MIYSVVTNNEHEHLPTSYEGSISITLSGHECQDWSATPYALTIGQNHNYCRSPDQDSEGAWCYTKNEDIKWEYCRFFSVISGKYS